MHAAASKEAPISASMRRRVVIASVLGNAFEWFDFAIYGMFAPIISVLYFPSETPGVSLMVALGTFGVAYVARPVGGVLLRIYSDKHGRKRALSLMILLMAGGTAMIGLLPTYASIGVAASVLMLMARLIQGFSVGGEFASASAMLVEFAPKNRRGLYGSFQLCSQSLAFSLGAGVTSMLTSVLSVEDLHEWGWRLPFLFGILIGPVGFYLRSHVDESPEFLRWQSSRVEVETVPLKSLFSQYPRQIIGSFLTVVLGTGTNYVMLLYLPIYAVRELNLPMGDAQLCTALAGLLILLLSPLAGLLSDHYGRRTVMLPAAILFGVVSWVMFERVLATPNLATLMATQFLCAFIMAFIYGPTPVMLIEALPVHVRSTGVSLAYNVGVMLFGGLAPFIVTALIEITHDKMMPAYYMLLCIALGVMGLVLLGTRRLAFQPAGHAQEARY